MNLSIRPMTVHDKDGIMHILRQTPEFKPEEVTVAEEVIDSYLGNPGQSGYYILVAQIDGEVKGYICYGPTPMTTGTWDIYWMAITPQEQGKGIGGALMKAGENEIKKNSGRLAIIETSSQPLYAKTLRFHINCGYSEIARIPDFYEPGDDKIILRKELS